MSIRQWSFARLWAVTAFCWLGALVVGEVLDYFDLGGLATFAIALIPAFLAGAWAGTHPDIAGWPRVRVAAMWAFTLGLFVAATECVGHWRVVGVALAAPVAVLTLRWYELTGGAPRAPLPPYPVSGEPIVTPPPPSRRRLPMG